MSIIYSLARILKLCILVKNTPHLKKYLFGEAKGTPLGNLFSKKRQINLDENRDLEKRAKKKQTTSTIPTEKMKNYGSLPYN
jgi:hypothetical protein